MSNRDEYVEKMKSQLDSWNAELTKWEAKSRDAQSGMQSEIAKQVEAFRGQHDQRLEQLKQVQSAAGEAWVDLAKGADDAWSKMRDAFDKAQSHFKK